MSSWHGYPSIFALGHKAVAELLLDPVIVQEKVDGSQLSFGVYDGQLRIKSKSAPVHLEAPGMFEHGVETIKRLDLHEGWAYRGEYLMKPKHNTLAYNRVPSGHIVLFDINVGVEDYLPYEDIVKEALRVGLEVVPLMYSGMVDSAEQVKHFLERESFLGGQLVEGIVIKNYARFGPDKHALMGKYVSEKFKEAHKKEWHKAKGDTVSQIISSLRTETRWEKAIYHLRDQGILLNAPQDIGNLLREVKADVLKEEAEWIKDKLFKEYVDDVLRGVTIGLPQWYKDRLLSQQVYCERESNP